MNHFGDGGVDYPSTNCPLTAEGGLALLDHWYAAWRDGVRGFDADGLAAAWGLAEGPYAEHPMAGLVLHVNREAIHHGAEVTLLRDLYLHSKGAR